MIVVVILSSALLAGVAAAGILRPFLVSRVPALDPPADPLEDRRRELLRSLRDLDEDRAAGRLGQADYRLLRAETEARAVAVLRELERPERAELAAAVRRRQAVESPRSRLRTGLILAAVAVVGAVVVAPLLAGALQERGTGAPITGGIQQPLAFFEQRVREHPTDLAARLDLAEAYLARGQATRAVEQYLQALTIDPENTQARTRVGVLLYQAGKPDDALEQLDRALAADPHFPEALYYRGLILRALGRDRPAAASLRAYLEAAPFGSHRDEVRALLERLAG